MPQAGRDEPAYNMDRKQIPETLVIA